MTQTRGNEGFKMRWPPAGFHVMIKPCGASCNLRCDYCFYLPKAKLYPDRKKRKMTIPILERFTRQYIQAQRVPEVTFGWQGGEPTLMGIDFFKKAVEFQKKYAKPGMRINNAFQTNGTLINEQWAKFFHKHNFLLGVSIDGPPYLHDRYRHFQNGKGSLEKSLNGIELLKKNNVEFNILACVNSLNADHPLDVYRYFKDELEVNFIQFIPIVERVLEKGFIETNQSTERSVSGKQYGNFLVSIFDEWVRNDVGKMFVQIFDVTLGAFVGQPGGLCIFSKTCGDALALEHNGDLYACDHFVKPSEKRGNIMKTALPRLVQSKEQRLFGEKKYTGLPSYCKKCEVFFACNGGCPKNRILTTPGGESGLNSLCVGYKQFFTHIAPYMQFMANELHQRRPPAGIMEYLKDHEIKSHESN